ncbi:MAG: hypothetical protein EBR82_07740 [Caulobacteraceae bacterium]|nr:hypothetical protein [Caulobacteraceae bacterium]
MALSACAAGPAVQRATLPLEILRDAGQPPRMGEVRMTVGGYREGEPFMLDVYFDRAGETLGQPTSVSWQHRFMDYCRDTPTWLQSVLIGPSGQVWGVQRVFVPAGPVRQQDWSSGGFSLDRQPGAETQALLDAMADGGRFSLALRDDEGQLWNRAELYILPRNARDRLYAANRATLATAVANPEATPVATAPMLEVREAEPVRIPATPGACPVKAD